MKTIKEVQWQTIFYKILTPLVVFEFYLIVFSSITKHYVPNGVSAVFFHRMALYLLIPLSLSGILTGILYLTSKNRDDKLKLETEESYWWRLAFVLIPLLAILQYIITNSKGLYTSEILLTIAFSLAFCLILIFILPWLLKRIASPKVLAAIGFAFCMTMFYMPLLSQHFHWLGEGSLKIQVAFLFTVFLFALILLSIKKNKIVVLMLLVFFVANSAFLIIQKIRVEKPPTLKVDDNNLALLSSGEQVRRPNIYLLIYDSYVTNETMLSYGIDNSAQQQKLIDWGFKLYPGTYSLGAASLQSMRIVLDINTEHMGEIRDAVSGNGKVQNVLKELGYENYCFFTDNYFFKGTTPTWDNYFPKIAKYSNQLWLAILMGEFRFDFGYDKVALADVQAAKAKAFGASNRPKFIYSHIGPPGHSQNSGVCLENEKELYAERLEKANKLMDDDLEKLLKSDPNAIIVVAGDHGPYLTKNCTYLAHHYTADEITRLDIQDRFGSFLAIRWPEDDFEAYDEISILQDIFPAIFAYMYQDRDQLDAKLEPISIFGYTIAFLHIDNGIIVGGANDGEPLFLNQNE